MKQIALLRIGDRTEIVAYQTDKGFHSIEWQDRTRYIVHNPTIRPVIITNLGDLISVQNAPKMIRGRLEREYQTVATEGMALRFFQGVGEGIAELPAATVLDGWTATVDAYTKTLVEADPRSGRPRINQTGLVRLQQELADAGYGDAKERAEGIADSVLAVQSTGYADGFVREAVLDRTVPRTENFVEVLPYCLYFAYLGLEFGSNTPVGEWYAGADRGWVLLLFAAPLLIYVAYQRWKAK